MKTVLRLRFNSPEPSQLRSNALSGIMNNGDEKYEIKFDDVNGIVHLFRGATCRSVPLSACAWVEWQLDLVKKEVFMETKLTPEQLAMAKGQEQLAGGYKKL